MLVLIAATYACIELREFFPKGSETREAFKAWHFSLGLSVLGLVLIRILARLSGPSPVIAPALPRWQLRLAWLMHVALYLLMAGLPVAGWLILSGKGARIEWFGLPLPAIMGPDEALAKQIKSLHETAGEIGYWLIGLHAAMGLVHHYLIRDNTLLRMLPQRTPPLMTNHKEKTG